MIIIDSVIALFRIEFHGDQKTLHLHRSFWEG